MSITFYASAHRHHRDRGEHISVVVVHFQEKFDTKSGTWQKILHASKAYVAWQRCQCSRLCVVSSVEPTPRQRVHQWFRIFRNILKLRYFFYDILCHWDWVFHFFKSLTNMVRRQWVLCHLPHWVYATKPLVYGGLLPFSVSSVAVCHFCRQSLFATQLYSSKLWTILLFCGVARVASHPHDLVIYEFKVCK